jgi:hypothetical protein
MYLQKRLTCRLKTIPPHVSRIEPGCILLWVVLLVFGFLASSFIWDALIRPILFSGPAHRAEVTCDSHLHKIGISILQYTQDWDERFPPAASWSSNLKGLKSSDVDKDVLQCPSAQSPFGYAFNQKIAGKSSSDFSAPSEQVMVFESDSQTPNEAGGVEKLPAQPRHAGRDLYVFLDGHFKGRMRSIPAKW